MEYSNYRLGDIDMEAYKKLMKTTSIRQRIKFLSMFSESPVTVFGDDEGRVIFANENKEGFARIFLVQDVITNRAGFVSKRRRLAKLEGPTDDLRQLVEKQELTKGKVVPGRIYIHETTDPQWGKKEGKKHEPKINPTTGRLVLVNKQPVYYQTYYDDKGVAQDTFIIGPTEEGDQVKEPIAQAAPQMAVLRAGEQPAIGQQQP